MDKILTLIKKYKSFIAYAIFGVLTTLVNILSYDLFYSTIGISNVASTIIAWMLATVFAFITNKLWVFDSKSRQLKVVLYELVTFYICRIATGILDVAVMYVAVDVLNRNAVLWKAISNVAVIVLNYIASKLVIFRKKKGK